VSIALSTPIPLEKRTTHRKPLVSASVEAGFPSPADDHLKRGIDLNEELIRNPAATFLVRVKRESIRDTFSFPYCCFKGLNVIRGPTGYL
jgi:SOS-response transcriptional repressor LexA